MASAMTGLAITPAQWSNGSCVVYHRLAGRSFFKDLAQILCFGGREFPAVKSKSSKLGRRVKRCLDTVAGLALLAIIRLGLQQSIEKLGIPGLISGGVCDGLIETRSSCRAVSCWP